MKYKTRKHLCIAFDSIQLPCYSSFVRTYSGIPVSSGIGIGAVKIIENKEIVVPNHKVYASEKQNEWDKFENACKVAIDALSAQIANADSEQADIFQTHLMMIADPEFIKEVKTEFDAGEFNVEYVLDKKVKEFSERLRASGNDYLMDRADDIIDAYNRVFRIIQGLPIDQMENFPDGSVVVADSLKPSDALALSKKNVSAIITHEGGTTSHLAILARSYGIPYISGIYYKEMCVTDGSLIIVDGNTGSVIYEPDVETEKSYKEKQKNESERKKKLKQLAEKCTETKDGKRIELFANISSPDEAELAFQAGADGIGLFRTEFLFMSKKKLSEQEQYEAYCKVLDDMKGKPVVIRTLDAGGDKIINEEGFPSSEEEKNPLLGWRAVRFCLDNTKVFKTQLKALLRAGATNNTKRNLNIMVPMLSAPVELEKTLAYIEETKKELKDSSINFADDIPVGIMVETPAAAVMADEFAKKSSFFSIGTNDLTQYTICVDRENAKVSGLYNEFHPAVIQLIKNTIDAADKANISLSVCGELAGKKEGAFLLYGLGVRKLSVSVSVLNTIKEMFSLFTESEIQDVVTKAVALKDADKTKEYILNTLKERM